MASLDESSIICNTSFRMQMSEALDEEDIVKKFKRIMSPVVSPIMDALKQAYSTIALLQKQAQEKGLGHHKSPYQGFCPWEMPRWPGATTQMGLHATVWITWGYFRYLGRQGAARVQCFNGSSSLHNKSPLDVFITMFRFNKDVHGHNTKYVHIITYHWYIKRSVNPVFLLGVWFYGLIYWAVV